MRRSPNPWILLPALVMGALAGLIGWLVTDVGCLPPPGGGSSGCPGLALGVAVVSGLAVAAGTILVLVLVYRSLAEWKERQRSAGGPEGPGR